MKKLWSIIFVFAFANIIFAQVQNDTLIDCAKAANKKGKMVYLKSFQTKLNVTKTSEKFPIMLSSGVKYRFFLCENAAEKPEGIELVLTDESHPENAPYGTTKKKGTFFFECNKAGTYYVMIRYKPDAQKKTTNAAAVLFYVKKNK